MAKQARSNPLGGADAAAQAKHRPDTPKREVVQGKTDKRSTERNKDQINVLIRKGNAKPFRIKALTEDTTMSDLIDQWIEEYLQGQR